MRRRARRICSTAMFRRGRFIPSAAMPRMRARALDQARAMKQDSDLCRRHRALFHGADGWAVADAAHSRRGARQGPRLAGGDRRRSASRASGRARSAKPRRSCAPPIRSGSCAPMKCSRRRAGRCCTGNAKPARRCCKGLTLARFVLDPPRPLLRDRIARRFEAMLERWRARGSAGAGRTSIPRCPPPSCWACVPCSRICAGEMSREDAMTLAITATRQFAKRQMTWFRNRMADYVWIRP